MTWLWLTTIISWTERHLQTRHKLKSQGARHQLDRGDCRGSCRGPLNQLHPQGEQKSGSLTVSRNQVPQPWPYYHYHGSKNIICCTAEFPCHSTLYPPTSSLTGLANHLDLMHIISNSILSIEQNSGRRTWRTRSPTCALFVRNSASILEQFVQTELNVFFLAGNLSSTHKAARQIKNYLLVKTCRLKPWCRFLQSYQQQSTVEGGNSQHVQLVQMVFRIK